MSALDRILLFTASMCFVGMFALTAWGGNYLLKQIEARDKAIVKADSLNIELSAQIVNLQDEVKELKTKKRK